MEGFIIYTPQTIEKFITRREGEIRFGEKVKFAESFESLKNSSAKYVIFGIPEDIGVRANSGKPGTAKAWKICLQYLLNIQANKYTNPENLLLLGEVDCREAMSKAANIGDEDPNYHAKLGDLLAPLDLVVSKVIYAIVSEGKIPIIIGGGHNNSYGNIKGTSRALKKPVNILNIDAHTDMRLLEHRHSGNGFSYARRDKFLGKYRMFGIHQNYTPAFIFDEIDASQNDHYRLFEHLILKSSSEILQAFKDELEFATPEDFGLELDCDSIRDFPSSAQTPSGFSFNMVRNFVAIAGEEENIKYLHICEAAVSPSTEGKVGKALSYFVTDFIKTSV